ncbi:MAG TPA: DUF1289 domain-containing protein [Hyphomicrobiaceae bacterium]|nr:DUF1289 domain-containing protein [Hyphomicrobiaceae bacterium]
METPCVNVCVLEAASGLCAGCGRSLDEISRWATMTDTERRRIMLSLPDRRRQVGAAAER